MGNNGPGAEMVVLVAMVGAVYAIVVTSRTVFYCTQKNDSLLVFSR